MENDQIAVEETTTVASHPLLKLVLGTAVGLVASKVVEHMIDVVAERRTKTVTID